MNSPVAVESRPASPSLLAQWLITLLMGSAFYAAYHGVAHFSDWCYLAVATGVAAMASLLMIPINYLLLKPLYESRNSWPAPNRAAWLLLGTAALFGLANLPVWPLHTMLGPGSTGPWGLAALITAPALHWKSLTKP